MNDFFVIMMFLWFQMEDVCSCVTFRGAFVYDHCVELEPITMRKGIRHKKIQTEIQAKTFVNYRKMMLVGRYLPYCKNYSKLFMFMAYIPVPIICVSQKGI